MPHHFGLRCKNLHARSHDAIPVTPRARCCADSERRVCGEDTGSHDGRHEAARAWWHPFRRPGRGSGRARPGRQGDDAESRRPRRPGRARGGRRSRTGPPPALWMRRSATGPGTRSSTPGRARPGWWRTVHDCSPGGRGTTATCRAVPSTAGPSRSGLDETAPVVDCRPGQRHESGLRRGEAGWRDRGAVRPSATARCSPAPG